MSTPPLGRNAELTVGEPIPPAAPAPAITGQITLALTAVATVVAFIWHKDFSSIVPALGTLATAAVGAALAIESAIKHRTLAMATTHYNAEVTNRTYQRAQLAQPGGPGLVASTLVQ